MWHVKEGTGDGGDEKGGTEWGPGKEWGDSGYFVLHSIKTPILTRAVGLYISHVIGRLSLS